MSSKSIVIILSYTASKFARFFETQCILQSELTNDYCHYTNNFSIGLYECDGCYFWMLVYRITGDYEPLLYGRAMSQYQHSDTTLKHFSSDIIAKSLISPMTLYYVFLQTDKRKIYLQNIKQ